jgi:putative membrane protein
MSFESLLSDWLASLPGDPWPVVLPLVGTALAAVLYWLGVRYERRTGIGQRVTALHAASFYSGLLLLLLAIASPLDTLADESLAAHMMQHEVIILVAPPLILLGAPLWPMWRALPLGWRRVSLRWLLRQGWTKGAKDAVERVVGRPVGAWLLFIGVFLVWHIPPLYDFALEHEAAHAVEHITFLGAALAFWAQVIPSFPIQPRLSYLRRAGYLFTAAITLHLVSVFIDIAAQPIYVFYGVGPSAVADQTSAGALMDVSGQVVFTIAILIYLYLWLREDERKAQADVDGASLERAPAITARGALLIAEAEADLMEPVPHDSQPEG